MFLEYKNLSDEELDLKLEEVMKKINMASRMGQDALLEQLQHYQDMLQLELMERMEMLRFNAINARTPESFIVGEDDDTDAPTNNRT